jgi:hypothetical protein
MVAMEAINKKTNAGVRRENSKNVLLLIKSGEAARDKAFDVFQFKQPATFTGKGKGINKYSEVHGWNCTSGEGRNVRQS